MPLPSQDIETGALIQNILVHNLNIPAERISNYNADWNAPKDDGVYIVITIDTNPPYAHRNTYYTGTDEAGNQKFYERQSMSVLEDVTVSVISQSTAARKTAPLVALALMSTYAIQMQEKYGLKLTRPYSRDASEAEATSRLNRFDLNIKVYRGYTNVVEVDYFDKFPLAVPTLQA